MKDTIEVKERTDLMDEKLSNVWLEVVGAKQKTLICTVYREFSNLVVKGQMSDLEQRDRWQLLLSHRF